MDYKPSAADPDVLIRPAAKPNGLEYYEYLFAYADNILVISHNPTATMQTIKSSFRLKDDPAPPKNLVQQYKNGIFQGTIKKYGA